MGHRAGKINKALGPFCGQPVILSQDVLFPFMQIVEFRQIFDKNDDRRYLPSSRWTEEMTDKNFLAPSGL